MSRSISFGSRSFPGCVPPDSRCLPWSGVSGKTSVDSFHSGIKLISDVKFLSLRHASRPKTFLCNASPPSKYRRNSDYSRPRKHGYSHNGKRHTAEKDGFEDLEESEAHSSKNGSLLSPPGSQKFQATAAPGPKEKEIVELFRKVQAKLRERAAMTEEKKVEDKQGKGKENGTVDSLLKLLRKHSVQQGKNTKSANNNEFILDDTEPIGPSMQERNTNSLESNSRLKKHEIEEGQGSYLSRPKSSFQKRSPVPKVKFQPVYTHNSVNHVSQDNLDDTTKGVETDSEFYLEQPAFSEESVYDEMEDETSEIYESEHEHDIIAEEQIETSNLSRMKLSELRTLARSRGMKGFSKLKKSELVELLNENST